MIDYSRRINVDDIWIWQDQQEKCGLGLSKFGRSDFGREWSAGISFGAGLFGQGEFGVDADAIEWVSDELAAGRYKFGITIIDGNGNISEASETEEITVIPEGKGAEDLQIVSFEKLSNSLVLGVS